MAIALDQVLGSGNSTASTATTSLVTAAAVAAGGTLIILCGRFAGTAATQSFTTTGGLTWTADHNVTSGSLRIYQWRANAPAGLASGTTLTVTHSSVVGGLDCIIVGASYTGFDTVGSPVTAFNGAGASTAAWSSANVTGNSGDALIGGAFSDGAAASSLPTAPAAERVDRNAAGQSETCTLIDKVSIAGTDSLQGTWNAASGHVAIGVAYRASGGAVAAVRMLGSLGAGT